MRQVVLEAPRRLVIREARGPEAPGPDEALVRLRCGGVCGSDLSAYRGTSPMIRYPRVLGHELLVDVLEAPGRPELAGRRAVVEPLLPCGRCRACRLGRGNCCADLAVLGVHVDGGLQDAFSVPARLLHPVPEALPDELAVLAEPTAVAYHAVRRAAPDAGGTAVVLGAGTIGLLVAQLLRRARGLRVLVHDRDPWRLERAAAVGMEALGGDAEAVRERVRDATDGELADVVFEATGHPDCTRLASDLVAHAGRVVLIGWNPGPTLVDTVALMRKEVDLLGSRNSVAAFGPVLRLLAGGAVDAQAMVTHRFPLAEAPRAFEVLEGSAPALKVLLTGSPS
jgi:L-gulonate 5-dehydrogenase